MKATGADTTAESTPTATTRYTLGSYQPKACYDDSSLQDNSNDSAALPPKQVQQATADFVLKSQRSMPNEGNILDHDVALLHRANHGDPFSVLGPHSFECNGESCMVIRGWVKDAKDMAIRILPGSSCAIEDELADAEGWLPMTQRCAWLFQKSFTWRCAKDSSNSSANSATDLLQLTKVQYELRVLYEGDDTNTPYLVRDAYNFPCSLPDNDLKLFQSGSCWHVDNLMGSHSINLEGAEGIRFAVWAPNAVFVSVVADFNQWDGRAHPMRKRHEYGIWELFVPSIAKIGQKYGYKIHSKKAQDFVKIDPWAQEFENPPAHASVISGCDDSYKAPEDRYQWGDSEWLETRKTGADTINRKPMSIYEVHLPSWMRGDGNSYLGYRELAHRLVKHLKELNFTHVEFLPLAHHPFEGSWGYQVSGFYAPYSRLGNPDDLKYLIDVLHQNGIGVFMDFVPAHFVKDDWGLVYYDGEPVFEYADPREGEHRTWGTMVFNFRRNEVRSFLLGAAYHWLRRYHIDGLRIDAVSSMLYKNYCRDEGDWLPNEFGGDANLEAINMLQELNWVIHKEFPGVFTMAEEATSWKGVTDKKNGLGFDAKWDLGWMNDTLAYLCTPTPLRPIKHSKLTFRGLYMAHENWVLPLSHDEVVSGKGSLLDKCGFAGAPFDERIATMKSLFTYQIGLGGRPLVFMGAEFGQGREWKESRSVDWHEAAEPLRSKFKLYVADLLGIYKQEGALHAGDDDAWNFKWTECDNAESCVIAWLRHWVVWNNDVLVVCNFSAKYHQKFPIGVPHGGKWSVLINSDDWKYGGSMRGPGNEIKVPTTQGGRLGWPHCLWLDIAPYSSLILKAPQPEPELQGLQMKLAAAATAEEGEFPSADLTHTTEVLMKETAPGKQADTDKSTDKKNVEEPTSRSSVVHNDTATSVSATVTTPATATVTPTPPTEVSK